MVDIPMSKEARELAEKNHDLIYSFCNDHHIDRDEFYGVAAIGLCKAATIFDPEKGRFSTVAYRCMRNEYFRWLEIARVRNPDKITPLSLSYFEEEDREEAHKPIKPPTDDNDFTESIHSSMMFERLWKSLSDRERAAVAGKLNGKSNMVIGESLGITGETVRQAIKRARIKYEAINASKE